MALPGAAVVLQVASVEGPQAAIVDAVLVVVLERGVAAAARCVLRYSCSHSSTRPST